MNNNIYYLFFISIISGILLTACGNHEWLAESDGHTTEELAGNRRLVAHEVSVALDGVCTRVDYASSGEGLQLSWEAEETLGVYIQKGSDSYVYAGTVTSNGTAGDRGARRFSGTIAEKSDAEQYVYIHPALSGETQGNAAHGKIDFTHQTGDLSSIKNYIPLIWHEGSSRVSNQGYALHLQLTFNENPGTITQITLQTMPGVGETSIFPASFDASTMSASTTYKQTELTVSLSVPATEHDGKWMADAYLACSHLDAVNVFRTKFNVKVSAANTYYNEFRSFPGQESATSETGLKMLANGKCYHLATTMSKGVATTVINSTYKVNSLLGMWDVYGKTIDPFGQVKTSDLPSQLDCKEAVKSQILTKKSTQGTPTFTWDLLVKQITLNGNKTGQENVSYNNLLITSPTEVYVTFLSEYAWSQNLLGYYHYPTAGGAPSSPGSVLKTIIFPNVSKPGHVPFNKDGTDGGANINPSGPAKNIGNTSEAPLQEFTTVQLLYNNPDGTVSATFPAGTTIGFMMMRDTQASSGGTTGEDGSDTPADYSGYSPRQDNTLINWSAWRLFTNTAWNSNNTSWYGGSCSNYFVSGKIVGTDGNVIDGLAIYGAKDDPDHNYSYSFSSMLFMVSTSDASAMTVQVPGALNLGTGDLVLSKP